jgi:hypothetical protein
MLPTYLDIAIGPEQEQTTGPGMRGDVPKEREAGNIRPVQIIEQKDDRSKLGHGLQEPGDRPKHPLLLILPW